MNFVILMIGSYLLGSLPFAMIIATCQGKDLRNTGSGNIGATNLARACGKKWGYVCFILDVAKGMGPMLIGKTLIVNQTPAVLFLWLGAGLAAVIGHVFPVYLKFKGGKGVATSFGVALGLWPYFSICAAFTFIIWVAVVLKTRYISLASIIGAIIFPISLAAAIIFYSHWQFAELWPLLIAATIIPVFVILRHRENIKRLVSGTESRVPRKNRSPSPGN